MDAKTNPMGTDGSEFIEYTAPQTEDLTKLFSKLGFTPVAKHRSKKVTLYKQGDINFIVNAEPESFAQTFAKVHGPSVCAIAFRVQDAAAAFSRRRLGRNLLKAMLDQWSSTFPPFMVSGDSLIYLVDRYGPKGTIYDVDFIL